MAENPFGQSFINRIFGPPIGVQTQNNEERINREGAGRAGAAQSRVLQKLNEIRAANPNLQPNQLIQQIINTPEFVDVVASGEGGDMGAFVTGIVQSITAPTPESLVVPQGSTQGTVDPTTKKFTPGFTNPDLSGQKPTITRPGDVAIDNAGKPLYENTNKDPGQMTQTERAAQALVEQGWLEPEEVPFYMLPDGIKIVPEKNRTGDEIGWVKMNTVTGEVTRLEGAPPSILSPGSNPQRPGGTPSPYPDQIGARNNGMVQYRNAISSIESDGSGGYRAVGPKTKSGDRAWGRYQVMGANIPDWTREALGKSMTIREFLMNPTAQDAVFDYKFQQFMAQNGGDPGKAALVWFTGSPNPDPNVSDGYTKSSEYLNKFNAALGNNVSLPHPTGGADFPQNFKMGSDPQGPPAGAPTFGSGPTDPNFFTGVEQPAPTSAADAAAASGVIPNVASLVSSLAGQIDAGLVDEDISRSRSALGMVNEAIIDWGRSTGRAAMSEQERVQKNYGLDGGLFGNPVENIIKMQELRRQVEADIAHQNKIWNDRSQPGATLQKAKEAINAGERLLEVLGSEKELGAALTQARTMTAKPGFARLSDQLTRSLSTASDAVTNAPGGGGLSDAQFQQVLGDIKKGKNPDQSLYEKMSDQQLQTLIGGK